MTQETERQERTTAQKSYIVREREGDHPFPRNIMSVWYKTISRPTGESLGGMRVFVSTGKYDKTRLSINLDNGHGVTIRAAHDDLKKHIRRLREQEAAELDAIDAEMEALRQRRNQLLKKAWDKGNVVTVKELIERIHE